jgi:hypothetical protein
MHDECEYAQNNGPSLHGRKRVRQPDPLLGDGMAPPVLPSGDGRRFFGGGRGGSGGARPASSLSGGSTSGAEEEEDEVAEDEDGGTLGPPLTTRRAALAAEPKPTLRQVFAAAMAEAAARGARLHWKTLERLTRLHQEELQEALQAQSEHVHPCCTCCACCTRYGACANAVRMPYIVCAVERCQLALWL